MTFESGALLSVVAPSSEALCCQAQDREDVVRFKRLAQCLGALIGDLVAVQGQDREDGVRFKRLAQCLGALIGGLLLYKDRTVRMFASSALPNALAPSSETLLPSKPRTVRMTFDSSALLSALAPSSETLCC